MRAKRRAAGGLESDVLAALWAAGRALTTGEVVDALGGGLAYTTVQTILSRLHGKGAVTREPAGRAYAYAPVLDAAGLTARRMRALLDRDEDPDAVLARFVGALSPEQETSVAAVLGRARRGRRR